MDYTSIIAAGMALLLVLLITLYARRILDWWDQKQTDRKRQQAHAGKVKCEETKERCSNIATVLTHNGYYCDEHWEENSKYFVNGGWVTWNHVLYHVIRKS